jgi:hypothetical protein
MTVAAEDRLRRREAELPRAEQGGETQGGGVSAEDGPAAALPSAGGNGGSSSNKNVVVSQSRAYPFLFTQMRGSCLRCDRRGSVGCCADGLVGSAFEVGLSSFSARPPRCRHVRTSVEGSSQYDPPQGIRPIKRPESLVGFAFYRRKISRRRAS